MKNTLKLAAALLFAVAMLAVAAEVAADDDAQEPIFWILTPAGEESPPQVLPVYQCGDSGTCDHLNQDQQRSYLWPDGATYSGTSSWQYSVTYVSFGGMCFPAGYVPIGIQDGYGWD